MVLLQLLIGGTMSLGENLQQTRRERGMRQEELAEKSGVSLTQISKIERNETDPRLSTIEKLAKALDCSPNILIFNEKTEGLSGMLKRCFERASKLEPRDQAALIKVMNMACAGGTTMRSLEDMYKEAEEEAKESGHGRPEDHMGTILSIEEWMEARHHQYHNDIDELAEQEMKKSHP